MKTGVSTSACGKDMTATLARVVAHLAVTVKRRAMGEAAAIAAFAAAVTAVDDITLDEFGQDQRC